MQPDRDLDRELRDLAPRVEYPPTPDLAGSVRARLDAEGATTPTRTGSPLWWVAAAAMIVLVAIPVLATVLTTGGFMAGGAGSAGGGGGEVVQQGIERGRTQLEGAAASAGGGEDMPTSGGDMPTSGGGSQSAGSELQAVRTPNSQAVPEVVGMPVLKACRKLWPRDYVGSVLGVVESDTMPSGRVISQNPRAGSRGFQGQPVDLVVSEPYPAAELGRKNHCYDLTEYGPGGKPNVPNEGRDRQK